MTHTKGPWKIRLQDIYGSDESYICTWSGTIDDARLIAAAPDLLKALEQVDRDIMNGLIVTDIPRHKRIAEAIQKARES